MARPPRFAEVLDIWIALAIFILTAASTITSIIQTWAALKALKKSSDIVENWLKVTKTPLLLLFLTPVQTTGSMGN